MKNTLISLGLILFLSACGEDIVFIAPPVEATECTILQVSPTTETSVTINVVCSGGSDIDTATVTLDGTINSLDFTGNTFDDIISFRNLSAATNYTTVLDVVAGSSIVNEELVVNTNEENNTTVES